VVVPPRGLRSRDTSGYLSPRQGAYNAVLLARRGQAGEGLPLIDSIHGAPNGGCQKASVGLPCLIAAGRAQAVEAGQLVRVAAIAVEVLRVGAAGALRGLPHLAQVGVEVAGAVACPRQAVGQRAAAAVARPHQAILLVVAEVLRLAAP